MVNFVNRVIVAAVFTAATAVGLFAQNGGSSGPFPEPVAALMPFASGETLTYEGKISKIIRGIAVADLTFTVSRSPIGDDMLVSADARSKGTLLKLFRFSFLQEIESTFTPEARIKHTKKRDVQKERVRESEAAFDYSELRVTYTEVNPKEPMRPPRKIASQIVPETYDMVSAIYRLRMLPLAVGSTFQMTISDSGLVYSVPVRVTGRERQKTVLGNVWCFRIEPDVFGPDRLIESEGSMIIWITDDARRVPVRSQVNASLGKVEIKLKAAKNLKS